jgi:hypothetical protein
MGISKKRKLWKFRWFLERIVLLALSWISCTPQFLVTFLIKQRKLIYGSIPELPERLQSQSLCCLQGDVPILLERENIVMCWCHAAIVGTQTSVNTLRNNMGSGVYSMPFRAAGGWRPGRVALHHARFQGNAVLNTVTTQQYSLWTQC